MEKQTDPTEGRKYDSGKPEYALVPLRSLEEMTKVLTIGRKKYEKNNWTYVDDAQYRYFNAAMRHILAWQSGEKSDSETGLNHLAHAMCCISFMLERDIVGEEQWNKLYPGKNKNEN